MSRSEIILFNAAERNKRIPVQGKENQQVASDRVESHSYLESHSDGSYLLLPHQRDVQRYNFLLQFTTTSSFCRAMLCTSAAIAGTRCLFVCSSVRLSVTFVSCAKTNKDVLEFVSPSGSKAILVFRTKRDGPNPTGIPLTGASNARGMKK